MRNFIKYIESPDLLDERTINQVHELTVKYPYFQTAHLLKVKNLHNMVPEALQPELQLAAAYVTDRKTIYYLLHPISNSVSKKTSAGKSPEKEIKDSLLENIAETLTQQLEFIKDHHSDLLLPQASFSLDLKKVYGESDPEEDFVTLLDNSDEETFELIEDKTKENFLKPKREPLFDPSKRFLRREQRKKAEIPEIQDKETDILEEAPEIGVSDMANDDIFEPKSFTDWIERFSSEALENKPITEQEKNTPDTKQEQEDTIAKNEVVRVLDILSLIQKGASADEVNAANPTNKLDENKNPQFDLIDKFINSKPKIVPQKADVKLDDVSKDSVQESEHFITDTLAQIYVKQGHYAKAIFAYEKLSLKYPEKSTYFAAQITEIKKLINTI